MKEKFDRKQGIGGSDATRLYNGEWHDLYLEKIGEKNQMIYLMYYLYRWEYIPKISILIGLQDKQVLK